MTNQCPSTNDKCLHGRGFFFVLRHWVIDWSFVLRHSSFSIILLSLVFFAAVAQVPQGTRLRRSSMPSYRHPAEGNKLDFVITGSSVSNLNPRTLMVNQFELTS